MQLASYFFTDSYQSFRDSLVNLAVNNPMLCGEILTQVNEIKQYQDWDKWHEWKILSSQSMDHHTPVPPFGEYEPSPWMERPVEPELDDGIVRFLEWCSERKKEKGGDGLNADPVSQKLDEFLRDFYGKEAGKIIEFLLKKASPEVRQEVAANYFDADYMGRIATVDIVIKKSGIWGRWGNQGKYQIYTRKGAKGEETLLKFTHQVSAVYYLLYLIDCVNNFKMYDDVSRKLPPIPLYRNKPAFVEIYVKVYGLSLSKIDERYRKLLYREDELGRMRVGRESETTSDIRKTLAKVFEKYNESYVPYTMNSQKHLNISPERIKFDGDAKDLLTIVIYH